MKKFILIIIIFSLIGCTGAKIRPVLQASENIDSYHIGQIQEKTTGEVIVMNIKALYLPGFIVVTDFQIPGNIFVQYPVLKQGSACTTIGTLENGHYVCSLTERPSFPGAGLADWAYCLEIDKEGNPYGDSACFPFYLREWTDKPKNIFKTEKVYQKNSFRQELIYNGRSKDMVKLQYREYKDDLARPAFYQDLIYDLSESKIIGFKGMTIEIIEATNSFIKFIIKSPISN